MRPTFGHSVGRKSAANLVQKTNSALSNLVQAMNTVKGDEQKTTDQHIISSVANPVKRKTGHIPKKLKDPSAPRRPPSSFLLFSIEERFKVGAQLGKIDPGVVAVELGKRWAGLNKEVKKMWDEKGREAMVLFEEDKKKYRPSAEFLKAAAAHCWLTGSRWQLTCQN